MLVRAAYVGKCESNVARGCGLRNAAGSGHGVVAPSQGPRVLLCSWSRCASDTLVTTKNPLAIETHTKTSKAVELRRELAETRTQRPGLGAGRHTSMRACLKDQGVTKSVARSTLATFHQKQVSIKRALSHCWISVVKGVRIRLAFISSLWGAAETSERQSTRTGAHTSRTN